jgi:hypothetical protein
VILAVLIAQISVAGGSDESKIASLQRQVSQLRAEVNGEATTAKKKKQKRVPGPQGPPGPQGAPGSAGPPGSSAGGMLFGWIEAAFLPGPATAKDFSPLGSGDDGISAGIVQATPNSTVVLRDLFVRLESPPDFGQEWQFTLQGAVDQVLTCEITGSFATTCNSGAQSATVPPSGNLRLFVFNNGAATPSDVYYAYRVGSP